jgi:pilus assembly protein CpaC
MSTAGMLLMPSASWAQPAPFPQVTLTTGGSTVLTTGFDIVRIAINNPAIAEATAVTPREILVDGKSPGRVSLIVWGESQRVQYDVLVDPPAPPLQQQLRTLFPGENVIVSVTDEAVFLSGTVSNTQTALRIVEAAEQTSSKLRVVNLLQTPGGPGNQQVMLQVRVAEVNRRAVTELGASLFTSARGFHDVAARSTTSQIPAPVFDEDKLTFTDFLNLFVFDLKHDLGVVIRALKSKGFFQSLAEPTLVAYNGQEASFLAGGEIPIPVPQGITGAVTILFKEFGVRLAFRPTIVGDTIRLRVRPEVSALDFANAIAIGGFRVPALSTRRAETEVELRDGQSFAIGGLMSNTTQDEQQRVPGLGGLPVIGVLFRSKAERKEQTELIVLVTPRLVRALNPDEVPPLPVLPSRFLSVEEFDSAPDVKREDAEPAADSAQARNRLRQGYGGPPKLPAKAEAGPHNQPTGQRP